MGRTSEPLQASAGGGGHDDGIPEVAKSRTAVVKKKVKNCCCNCKHTI
jgi:hypothetical protein